MTDVRSLKCIGCDLPFGQVQSSVEHVIPNALGGRIKTTNATCINCNSSFGDDEDLYLIKTFEFLANSFDVIRDRGEHPDFRFVDPVTKLRYQMRAGYSPDHASGIRAERVEEGIRFHIEAPTAEIANRLLRKSRPKVAHEMKPIVRSEQPGGSFACDFGYSINDDKLLRSAARIATCFARHVGIPVDMSDSTLRYARGEDVARCPVGIPQDDVVKIADLPPNPIYHGIFLGRTSPTSRLIAYVFLFQYCEFIVEFASDYSQVDSPIGFLQNLVTGIFEKPSFTWLLDSQVASEWISERKLAPQRLKDRFVPLSYYLQHREQLWIDRAMSIGVSTYVNQRESGHSCVAASSFALSEANRVLARYNLAFDEFNIDETLQ